MREKVLTISLVGDAMARPLVEALEEPGVDLRPLASLRDRLRRRDPLAHGEGQDRRAAAARRDRRLARRVRDRVPGHGRRRRPGGQAALRDGRAHDGARRRRRAARARLRRGRPARPAGNMPLGYYKDAAKTAATFIEIDGERWVDPRRHGARRGRRQHHAARARLGVHQLRRREDLPRRGRARVEVAPRRVRRRGRRRARRAVGRAGRRGGQAAWRTPRRPPTTSRRTPGDDRRLQGAEGGAPRRRDRALAVGQGRLPLGQGPGARRGLHHRRPVSGRREEGHVTGDVPTRPRGEPLGDRRLRADA